MHYHIYCNQKSIHTNHLLAIEEFQKRLSAYCETSLHLQSTLLLPKAIHSGNHSFVYVHTGISSYTSEEFANFIYTGLNSGKSNVHVIIGFDENTMYSALETISDYDIPAYLSLSNANLSTATKTLLFYEQLYRGYTILQGKTYHK